MSGNLRSRKFGGVSINAEHLVPRLQQVMRDHVLRNATRIRVGDRWQTKSYGVLRREVEQLAGVLHASGVRKGDRIALWAANRPEWSLVDLAAMWLGAVTVPIYGSSTAEQAAHILRDSGAGWIFIGGAEEAARVPEGVTVVSFDAVDGVTPLAELLSRPVDPADAEAVAATERHPDDLLTLIYTSGTTGDPKGVMLTHRALCAELDALEGYFDVQPTDHSLCFLPLAHALERGWTYFVLSRGCMNTYVENPREVAEQLVLAKATLMVCVPKLYETVYTKAHAQVGDSGAKKRIFDWAIGLGSRVQADNRAGRRTSWWRRALLPVADKLVFASVRDAIGGPKTMLACGGAPLRAEVEVFFGAIGTPIWQGYGLTEAAPLVSFNSPQAYKLDTAGRVLTGGEMKIGAEGEILFRGANVMAGYWNNPEATAETIDADGWLHTGDVGEIDDDGFLTITDRIKDLIVTSGGKNVAPGPIEGLLLTDPLIEYAVIIGDNRPSLTLLVRPSLPELENLAGELQVRFADVQELLHNSEILEELNKRVHALTEKLAPWEQIRGVQMMLDELTTENGLLTPTLKVRRQEVAKRFNDLVEGMYSKIAARRKGDADKH
ncbi:long-chain fatty acid--CoA ligase [Parenemella sanctibonifatiensis]|uniref:Long-chain fatty acid--CoA ligase n=1 Tax=Parenemella sanctibonifatiensis TaxID=2016505 RepID=A0A255ECS9_9ACTN|nr:long-chain fatty acid--CoA ligase [Parenemella sanctibonifatiensis]